MPPFVSEGMPKKDDDHKTGWRETEPFEGTSKRRACWKGFYMFLTNYYGTN